jgi:hypothetical protein
LFFISVYVSTSLNDLGHKVVARIAWENMTPQARAKVVALLMAAPPDADLSSLFPNDTRPLPVREQNFLTCEHLGRISYETNRPATVERNITNQCGTSSTFSGSNRIQNLGMGSHRPEAGCGKCHGTAAAFSKLHR